MAKKQSKFKVMLSDVFQTNGLLITIFACVAIVIGGLVVIESPEKWWIALLSVAAVFLGIFFMFNAAIVIKVALSLLVLLITASFAFQAGLGLDPNATGGFIWMFGTLVVYFGSLLISYLIPSGQSRWSVLIVTELLYFIGVLSLALIPLSVSWTATAGIVTALVFYGVLFRFGARSRTAEANMPKNVVSEALDIGVLRSAELAGLESRPFVKGDKKAFIVWGERAYLLYPVKLDQAFGLIGRKNQNLSYLGKSINPWLRYLSFVMIPSRKARNADILLVLADTTNANGSVPKVIGVSIPDSKAVVPVGIMPSKLLSSKDEPALKKALAKLDASFQEFSDDLSKKQKQALSDFGEIIEEEKDSVK